MSWVINNSPKWVSLLCIRSLPDFLMIVCFCFFFGLCLLVFSFALYFWWMGSYHCWYQAKLAYTSVIRFLFLASFGFGFRADYQVPRPLVVNFEIKKSKIKTRTTRMLNLPWYLQTGPTYFILDFYDHSNFFLKKSWRVLSIWPCKLKLDEEKSTYGGLAQESGFSPTYLVSLLRLLKKAASKDPVEKSVIDMIWLVLHVFDWPMIIMIDPSGLLLLSSSHLYICSPHFSSVL